MHQRGERGVKESLETWLAPMITCVVFVGMFERVLTRIRSVSRPTLSISREFEDLFDMQGEELGDACNTVEPTVLTER